MKFIIKVTNILFIKFANYCKNKKKNKFIHNKILQYKIQLTLNTKF